MRGVALHSFQNGIVGVRVPGATAPSRSAGAKRSSPRDPPQGRALSNWSMAKARWNPPSGPSPSTMCTEAHECAVGTKCSAGLNGQQRNPAMISVPVRILPARHYASDHTRRRMEVGLPKTARLVNRPRMKSDLSVRYCGTPTTFTDISDLKSLTPSVRAALLQAPK